MIDRFNNLMMGLIVFAPVVYMTVQHWQLGLIWLGCLGAYMATSD